MTCITYGPRVIDAVFQAFAGLATFSGCRHGCMRMFRYERMKWVEAGIGLDSERNIWALEHLHVVFFTCMRREGGYVAGSPATCGEMELRCIP
jgi:hypothetical protein